MKTVLFMRHAKSDWNAPFSTDHERPINGRGRRAAAAMGRWVARIEQIPEEAISSTAVRALSTVQIAADEGDWGCDITHEAALYGADPRTVMQVIRAADERHDRILIAGHEPGVPLTVSWLLGDALLRFPTAAVARVDLHIDRWRDARQGNGQLIWFLPPRLLET